MSSPTRHPALAAVAVALVAPALTLLPTASAHAADAAGAAGAVSAARAALPTKRVVSDRADPAGQRIDATTMTLRAAAQQGRRASVTTVVPAGLDAGNVVVFYINTDTDPQPEIAYYAGVDSEFQGYRMKGWHRTGTLLPLACGRVRASTDETRTRLAFNPLCINKGVKSFSATTYLVEGSDPADESTEWLPGVRTFSGRVKAFAG